MRPLSYQLAALALLASRDAVVVVDTAREGADHTAVARINGTRPEVLIVDDVTEAQEKLLKQIIKKHSAPMVVHCTDSRNKRSKGDKHRDKAGRWHG